jgi:hypothetical protein
MNTEQLLNLIAFCTLMESRDGIIDKSPDYVMEKYERFLDKGFTDLSIRAMKDGWCTIQFNAFLGDKATTQTHKGGNTDDFYSNEGTLPKSQMLKDMHPEITKVIFEYGRWHHKVDYSQF